MQISYVFSGLSLCLYDDAGFTFIYFMIILQTLIMGNRDGIDEMSPTNSAVLLSILKLIDKYDMYGQVSYPKHHKQSEVPDIYRLAARTKVLCFYFL